MGASGEGEPPPAFPPASQPSSSQPHRQATLEETFAKARMANSISSLKSLHKAKLIPENDESDISEHTILNNIRTAIQTILDQAKTPMTPECLADKNRRNASEKEQAFRDYVGKNTECWQKVTDNLVRVLNYLDDTKAMANHTENSASQALEPILETILQIQSKIDKMESRTITPHLTTSQPSTYRDALLHPLPPKPGTNPIVQQQRAQAQAKIMARRIMTVIPKEAEKTIELTPNAKIIEEINDILDLEIDDTDTKHKISQISRFTHKNGDKTSHKLLLEFDSAETAKWVRAHPHALLIPTIAEFPPLQILPQEFTIVARFVPTHFRPENPNDIDSIAQDNNIDANQIIRTKWAKNPSYRAQNQKSAHLLITLSDPHTANRLITDNIHICHENIAATKSKKEPLRCAICQGYGHLARDKDKCGLQKNTEEGETCTPQCGRCPGRHETSNCKESRDKKFCINCISTTHNSFDRACPTFLRKSEEFDQRNPDNLMPYFITDEPYTQHILPDNAPRNPILTKHTPPPAPPTARSSKRQTTLDNSRTWHPKTPATATTEVINASATPHLPPPA
jgi:hypothetical protein